MHNFYHGSSSASFPGVFSYPAALKSIGRLLKEGKAPFSGELGMCFVSEQLSQLLSVVPVLGIAGAIEYALKLTPWNPKKGALSLGYQLRELSRIELLTTLSDLDQNMKMVLPQKMLLENLRFAQWGYLTAEEKRFVASPFPVIYGITYTGHTIPISSHFVHEQGIAFSVPIDNVTVYVSKRNKNKTEDYIYAITKECSVRAFDNLFLLSQQFPKV